MATKPTTSKPATKAKQAEFDWDEAMRHAKEMPTILPKLKVNKGESVSVEILSEKPRVVEYEEEDDDGNVQQKSFPVVEVLDLADRTKKTLALSAKTMQNGLGLLAANNKGSLKGLRCTIRCETYKHPKYGDNTPRYVVSEVVEEATAEAEQ